MKTLGTFSVLEVVRSSHALQFFQAAQSKSFQIGPVDGFPQSIFQESERHINKRTFSGRIEVLHPFRVIIVYKDDYSIEHKAPGFQSFSKRVVD